MTARINLVGNGHSMQGFFQIMWGTEKKGLDKLKGHPCHRGRRQFNTARKMIR